MKLKNSFKYTYEIYKQSLNTQKFLFIFLLSLILSIYGILAMAFGYDYITGFLNIIYGGIFIACLLLIILLNTINTYELFENNSFYIIRFSSKKKYLIELIKSICFSNLCVLMLNIIFILIGLNLFCMNEGISIMKNYNIPNLLYLVYSIIKLVIITQLISIINVLLLKILNNKFIVITNILMYILIAGLPISLNGEISTIIQLPLFFGIYLRYQLYSSFIFEIVCFLLYSSILYVSIFILSKLVLKKMKAVIK